MSIEQIIYNAVHESVNDILERKEIKVVVPSPDRMLTLQQAREAYGNVCANTFKRHMKRKGVKPDCNNMYRLSDITKL